MDDLLKTLVTVIVIILVIILALWLTNSFGKMRQTLTGGATSGVKGRRIIRRVPRDDFATPLVDPGSYPDPAKLPYPGVVTATNTVFQETDISSYVWLEKTDGLHQVVVLNGRRMTKVISAAEEFMTQLTTSVPLTILDTELYKDAYYIFDCPWMLGHDLSKLPFAERMTCCQEHLKELPLPYKFHVKKYHATTTLQDLLDYVNNNFVSPETGNEIDGIILQRNDLPYFVTDCEPNPRTHLRPLTILKLKKPHMNTLDFRLKRVGDHFDLYLYGSYHDVIANRKLLPYKLEGKLPDHLDVIWLDPYGISPSSYKPSRPVQRILEQYPESMRPGILRLSSDISKNPEKYDGKILELSLWIDAGNRVGRWIALREREDKPHPNGYKVGLNNTSVIFNPLRPDVTSYFTKKFAFGNEILDPYHTVNKILRKWTIEKQLPGCRSILDLAGGRGADAAGFYNAGITNIFAQDADRDALVQYTERITFVPKQKYEFLLKSSSESPVKKPNRILLNAIPGFLGPDNKEIIEDIKSRRELPRDGFDAVMMNYALHYLCNDPESVKELNRTVKELSRGKFIVSYFDGQKILDDMDDGVLELTVFTIRLLNRPYPAAMMALPTIDESGYREEPLVTKECLDLLGDGLEIIADYHPMTIPEISKLAESIEHSKLIVDYLRYIRVTVFQLPTN